MATSSGSMERAPPTDFRRLLQCTSGSSTAVESVEASSSAVTGDGCVCCCRVGVRTAVRRSYCLRVADDLLHNTAAHSTLTYVCLRSRPSYLRERAANAELEEGDVIGDVE